ncbi:MAG: hypothetical protein ACP5OY_08340 [Halothiobacillaceae bacterium]
MTPILPFIAGLISGAAVVTTLRDERGRSLIEGAASQMRAATDTLEQGARRAAEAGLDLWRDLLSSQKVAAAGAVAATGEAAPSTDAMASAPSGQKTEAAEVEAPQAEDAPVETTPAQAAPGAAAPPRRARMARRRKADDQSKI